MNELKDYQQRRKSFLAFDLKKMKWFSSETEREKLITHRKTVNENIQAINTKDEEKSKYAIRIANSANELDKMIKRSKVLKKFKVSKKDVYKTLYDDSYNRVKESQAYLRAYEVNKNTKLRYTSLIRLGEAINSKNAEKSKKALDMVTKGEELTHKEVMKKLRTHKAENRPSTSYDQRLKSAVTILTEYKHEDHSDKGQLLKSINEIIAIAQNIKKQIKPPTTTKRLTTVSIPSSRIQWSKINYIPSPNCKYDREGHNYE